MEENDTSNLTLNYTTYGYVDTDDYSCWSIFYTDIVFVGVCLGVSVCGLVGNGMVMWFVGFQIKRNPFTVYILNLAVADFSLSLLVFLLDVSFLIFATLCSLSLFFDVYFEFFFVLGFLCHLFDISSLGLLTALSVERCVSVLFPIWYRCHRPKHLSGIVSAALWALAGLFVSLLYFYTFTQDTEKVLAGLALVFSATCSLMLLISNLLLFLKLRCGSQRRHPGKLFVVILLNVIVFFAFGLPFNVHVFFKVLSSGYFYLYMGNTLLLALLDSSLNPVIYVLVGSCRRRRRFQGSVKVALCRVFEEKAGSEEGRDVPGDTVVEATSL